MTQLFTKLGLAAALMLALGTAPAHAEEPSKGMFRNVVEVFAPPTAEEERAMAEALELSEGQTKKMAKLSKNYRSDASSLLKKYERAYSEVVGLMESQDPDKSQTATALRAFHDAHSELVDREVDYWNAFKGILTPEQNRTFWNTFEDSRIRS